MKVFLMVNFMFCFLFLQAQKICFQYDSAGNQIAREFCINDMQNKSTNQIFFEESNLQKFFSEDVISYYPNPVKEELYLKWDLLNDNRVAGIEIYNLNGQSVAKFSGLEKENAMVISFVQYPVGIYHIILYYSNQQQKSIRIIKK